MVAGGVVDCRALVGPGQAPDGDNQAPHDPEADGQRFVEVTGDVDG